MIIIKKQPGHGGAANLGVVITLGSKNRINFNFSPEITPMLPEYIQIGYEDDKLYFLPAERTDGYRVQSRSEGHGRVSITPPRKHYRQLARFEGNHHLRNGYGSTYVKLTSAGNNNMM